MGEDSIQMNKGSRLHKIFTTPIFETKLELDIKEIKIFCKEYQQNNESATKSNVGGYQSHNLSLETPVLQSLISVIELVTLDLDPNFGAQIIQNMWFNVNQYNDSNGPHFHPFSVYSGTYYIKTPENCGSIFFEHPASDILSYYSNGTNALYGMPAIENTLYIFPSWLKHFVPPNKNKEERISISFNTSSKE